MNATTCGRLSITLSLQSVAWLFRCTPVHSFRDVRTVRMDSMRRSVTRLALNAGEPEGSHISVSISHCTNYLRRRASFPAINSDRENERVDPFAQKNICMLDVCKLSPRGKYAFALSASLALKRDPWEESESARTVGTTCPAILCWEFKRRGLFL